MALTIRKRISLDFLGEEYKDAYLIFSAIPVKDFEDIQTQIEDIKDDNTRSIKVVLDYVKKYFISGKAPDEKGVEQDVTKEDLDNLDQTSLVKCFELITGQNINEEQDFLDKDSKTQSSTTQDPQSNS